MSLIFRIITAAHARGTHHRLALDGVAKLGGSDALRWRRMFLKHAAVLVQGSKAPDDEFKDFKNHVLHPRDNFWGGAPEKARSWYGHLVEALAKGDWATATWCAGVLSHYLTDPINPLHTAQSEAENNIHRGVEWSISRSYDALKAVASADAERTISVPDADNWLEQLLCQAATDANAHYEKLIAHYDVHRGVVDPPSGLDIVAQRIVGELIGQASSVFATVLRRAIDEAKVAPPDLGLTLEGILGTLRIPLNKLLARIADARERRLVERMYDELKATGTVEVNLPADDRMVRDLYAAEVEAGRAAPDAAALFPLEPLEAVETTVQRRARQKAQASRSIPPPTTMQAPAAAIDRNAKELPIVEPARPAPRAADQSVPAVPVSRFRGEPVPVEAIIEKARAPLQAAALPAAIPAAAMPSASREASIPADRSAASAAAAAAQVVAFTSRRELAGSPRIYLTPAQDIVDAPSIGPKMAERLLPLGLKTVADLFAAAPEIVASGLALRGIDTQTVRDWQDQAQLVCSIPGLRGTHSQLLVGAGYRTAEAIAEAEADQLCARVLAFASSTDGQRVLRNGDAPDIERIKAWVENAQLAARVA